MWCPVALCLVLYGAPGAPENTIDVLGSMLIGARVRKLGPGTSLGTSALILCAKSGALNVEPRGGACMHVNNGCIAAQRPNYPWSGPGPLKLWLTPPRLVPGELTPLLNETGLPH